MALYQDGILISGANTLPKMTLAEYNALPADQRPTYWERTDGDYDDILAPKTDIATVESGTTASRAYSIGELVYVSGTLYRVKVPIASGAAFTEGTNVEPTNVSNRVKEIRQPRTIMCGVIIGTGGSYITFAHVFPKNIASARITKVFYIGLPAQPAVDINVQFDKNSGTDWAIPYAIITDSTMLGNMRYYASTVEIELTYS